MQPIGDYAAVIKLVLGEGSKYFALLLVAVLAVRLWRAARAVAARSRAKVLVTAASVTLVAAIVAYVSIRSSLALLYAYYGQRAFEAGRLRSALTLYETSGHYWRSADGVGRQGVCRLLLGDSEGGRKLLNEARTLRNGTVASFEHFYQGVYCFFHDQSECALQSLEASRADLTYHWNATKLLAAAKLDQGQTAEAARLIQPFLAADIQEEDQAYVVASLKLAQGATNEARAILTAYPPEAVSRLWTNRFEHLRRNL